MKRIYTTFFNGSVWCVVLLSMVFGIQPVIAQQQEYFCKFQKRALPTGPVSTATNTRSDTIDVLNYTINLDITDFTNKLIKGSCDILLTPKMNGVSSVSLDLLKLNIDSIAIGQTKLVFSYNDTLIVAALTNTMNVGDTTTLTVYYNGSPQGDPSGWGGFYFSGSHAFNLGVGFEADPHTYGRVWFPCFDNFVERSTYEFNIITSGGKVAACGGQLISETIISGDTIVRKWMLKEEIPTYLACVAVAPYTTVNQVFNGINGVVPIELYALPADTNNLKASFSNLQGCLTTFENSYGPYQWDKVGYSLVPFNSGAMEHASNIAYPSYAANGTLTYETLMAHELSHHWWGNLVTCQTQEDMWINEGMAKYSEFLFIENEYGWDTYIDEVTSNHKAVIHLTHHHEGGYRSISGIPHEYTYGEHVYDKGADVAHTLRGYLGDSLFFSGLSTFLANNSFTDVTSYDLRDQLSSITGVDLTDFFTGWVFNPGFPHFSIDSFEVSTGPVLNQVDVYIKQKLTGAPAFFNSVPIEITFMDSSWNQITEKVLVNGEFNSFSFQLPIVPVYCTLNKNNLISHAVSDDQFVITAPGIYILQKSLMNITVNQLSDSAFIRVEHNWVKPDPIKNIDSLKMELSPNRYWKVDGIFPANFSATARILFNGNLTNGGHLDIELLSLNEDSLRLLYRKNASEDWREFDYYTKNMLGISTNKFGYCDIDSLIPGEYTFANTKYNASSTNEIGNTIFLNAFPNPANDELILEMIGLTPDNGTRLMVHDITGKLITTLPFKGTTRISTSSWPPGLYSIELAGAHRIAGIKVMIAR